MDLISLRYFIETAKQRSISKAAVSLGVVQPALTRRIKLLEERMGAPLLLRHRRGVEPTEAGLLVLERANVILRLSAQLETEIKYQGSEPSGQVAFGFPPSIGILFVGTLLSECAALYPRMDLLLRENYSADVRSSLLSGQLDIGIMSIEAQHPELTLTPLFKETTWLVGRAEDWTLSRKAIDPSQLNGLPILVGSFMRILLEKHVARRNVELNFVAHIDSFSLAREALRAGAGFIVTPVSALDREIRTGEFVGAPIKGLEITRGLFHHRSRPLTRAAATLIELIHKQVDTLIRSRPYTFRRLQKSNRGRASIEA
jgi:LysR family nitrogen assimilation transcriptional regulator